MNLTGISMGNLKCCNTNWSELNKRVNDLSMLYARRTDRHIVRIVGYIYRYRAKGEAESNWNLHRNMFSLAMHLI